MIVAFPSAPVTPLPVATPVRVTVAPFTARPEVWFLTVKFTSAGIPAVTIAGLPVTLNTGTGAIAVTVVTPFVYAALEAVAVIIPADSALTLIVAFPSAPVIPVPVAAPGQ